MSLFSSDSSGGPPPFPVGEIRVPWSSDRPRDNTRYYTTVAEDYKNSAPFKIHQAGRGASEIFGARRKDAVTTPRRGLGAFRLYPAQDHAIVKHNALSPEVYDIGSTCSFNGMDAAGTSFPGRVLRCGA
jgi:hypothetical protein